MISYIYDLVFQESSSLRFSDQNILEFLIYPVHPTCLPEQTSLVFITKLLNDTHSRRSKQFAKKKELEDFTQWVTLKFWHLTNDYFYDEDMDKEKPNVTAERVFLNDFWETLGLNLAD